MFRESWGSAGRSPIPIRNLFRTVPSFSGVFLLAVLWCTVKLHQEGTIQSLYGQSFPVVLDLEATDDGHLSGFVNFYGNVRPEGFPVGEKFSIITDDRRAGMVQQFVHFTIRFVDPRTAQVTGYIDGSRAQFQNVNTVANVQAELDGRFATMAIEVAKRSTPEDDKPHPKVGAVAVKHGQLLGVDYGSGVESALSGRLNHLGEKSAFRPCGRDPVEFFNSTGWACYVQVD